MTVGRLNKDGTPRKRNHEYLNSEEIYYIHRHLEKGIDKNVIARACYCDLEDIEAVEKRYVKRKKLA